MDMKALIIMKQPLETCCYCHWDFNNLMFLMSLYMKILRKPFTWHNSEVFLTKIILILCANLISLCIVWFKQSLRTWFQQFSIFLLTSDFRSSRIVTSISFIRKNYKTIYILVYGDYNTLNFFQANFGPGLLMFFVFLFSSSPSA